jgi:uncharacterized membrane protein YraQ (UPF0718 family)
MACSLAVGSLLVVVLAMPESFSIFSTIVLAIFIEAMPFLAVGALLSALIEVLVPSDRLLRFIPKNRAAGIALGIAAGTILPTCECGVVPVIRRLMKKGVPAHVAISYMLSAPIVNPVVLASTWFAFPGHPNMVLLRLLFAAIVAAVVGVIAGRMRNVLVAPGVAVDASGDCNEHQHGASAVHGGSRLQAVLRHGAHEFLDMGKFLILGAIAAGLFKTYLPQDTILLFAENIFLQVVGMMILAILLSVCSEADAFVAASFKIFSPASQLAFITIGPMIDLKLIGMFFVTFRRKFFWVLMVVPIILILGLCLLVGVWL